MTIEEDGDVVVATGTYNPYAVNVATWLDLGMSAEEYYNQNFADINYFEGDGGPNLNVSADDIVDKMISIFKSAADKREHVGGP